MAEDQKQRDAFITQFMDITETEIDDANKFGELSNWDLDTAVASYYAANEEDEPMENAPEEDAPEASAPTTQQDTYTGPRTLGGAPAPEYQRPAQKKKPAKKTGVATLGSLGGGSSHDHGHDHGHDDDDDDEDDDGRGDLYAGGEKSGLSVQDPRVGAGPSNTKKVIEDILARAKQNAPRDGEGDDEEEEAENSGSHFRGTGQTLGGEGSESRTIPAPGGAIGPIQTRLLTIWRNGFTIDDGELRRFDDPENARALDMMRNGEVPLHLMNLEMGQPVDVKVKREDVDCPRSGSGSAFSGEGRRLGSPVPGVPSGETTTSIAETVAPAVSATASSAPTTASTVDESQPTLSLRVQLPDGTRLPARFNATDTIGDVYSFVQRASPVTQSRPWILATTFPSKDYTDRDVILGDVAEFKRGAAVVVKWSG